MQQTIIAVDRVTHRRGLLVEIHSGPVSAADIPGLAAGLSRRLYDRRIRVGLVVAT